MMAEEAVAPPIMQLGIGRCSSIDVEQGVWFLARMGSDRGLITVSRQSLVVIGNDPSELLT